MAKKVFILVMLLAVLTLAACDRTPQPEETVPATVQTQPATIPVTESSAPTVTTPTEPAPTQPPTVPVTEPQHSPLYIPGVDVEDVIVYFNEVCLDAEWVNGGDATKLQKWAPPIFYTIHGDPTYADLQTVADFTVWLNSIHGFPGIYEPEDPTAANLRIHFCTQDEMLSIMGSDFTGLDGAVTFWYMDDEIYDAVICIRTDLDQHLRNSVILEEIYNCLGPILDTALRPDSIIYSEFSDPQALTEIDELILKLLYHPQILCGMDAEECAAVIRQLYY